MMQVGETEKTSQNDKKMLEKRKAPKGKDGELESEAGNLFLRAPTFLRWKIGEGVLKIRYPPPFIQASRRGQPLSLR